MASLCTPAEVRALDVLGTDFPDPPFTDPVLQGILNTVTLLVDADCGDADVAKQAECALAAHFATMQNRSGAATVGQVVGHSDGRLTQSYASAMQGDADDWLRLTSYGMTYLLLRDVMVCGAVPLVLRC